MRALLLLKAMLPPSLLADLNAEHEQAGEKGRGKHQGPLRELLLLLRLQPCFCWFAVLIIK